MFLGEHKLTRFPLWKNCRCSRRSRILQRLLRLPDSGTWYAETRRPLRKTPRKNMYRTGLPWKDWRTRCRPLHPKLPMPRRRLPANRNSDLRIFEGVYWATFLKNKNQNLFLLRNGLNLLFMFREARKIFTIQQQEFPFPSECSLKLLNLLTTGKLTPSNSKVQEPEAILI